MIDRLASYASLSFVFMITGCVYGYVFSSPTVATFEVANATFDEAHAQAIHAATDIGLGVYFPDHDSGTFTALNTKAGGFGETTQLNYQLIKKSNGALEAVGSVLLEAPAR